MPTRGSCGAGMRREGFPLPSGKSLDANRMVLGAQLLNHNAFPLPSGKSLDANPCPLAAFKNNSLEGNFRTPRVFHSLSGCGKPLTPYNPHTYISFSQKPSQYSVFIAHTASQIPQRRQPAVVYARQKTCRSSISLIFCAIQEMLTSHIVDFFYEVIENVDLTLIRDHWSPLQAVCAYSNRGYATLPAEIDGALLLSSGPCLSMYSEDSQRPP